MDRDTKLITAWKDTPAQVHDSQAMVSMLRSPEELCGNRLLQAEVKEKT